MEAGVERLASAGRALDKVQTGLKLVDSVLKIGERAGLPLIPAVCSAARGVLQVVQASRTVINDLLSAAQRTIDVLELLQLMAENVKRMDAKSRPSVEDRMRELQRLLEDVRSAVAAFGKKGWLRHALNVTRRNAFSQLDSEITSQLDLLLKFYNLARDADIIDRLQAREYPVEAEVERQVAERKALGEAVDAEALENDREVVRGIAVASGVSDAEFQEELSELRSEMRDGFASTGVKLDEIKTMMAALGREPDRSSRLSHYAYDRRPNAPPGQKDKAAARLGGGTFGSTYRMRKKDGIDELRYAVKFIEDRDSELPQSKLAKEARLLAKLDHPHTVRYFDSFRHTVKARDEDEEDKSQFIIVMELLSGGSLEMKMTTPPQPPSAAATWVQQAASGLAYMHSLNLQHRDLKPANVMLDSAGRAKIIDFGLACVSSASRRSRTKTKVGTDAYMSPEKAFGKRYGPEDDVWAAGCILAELLLGRTIGNVALDPIKRQRAIAECKSASEWLGSWVEGCLQETPGRRPAAAVLEQGLASLAASVPDVPALVALAKAGDFAPLAPRRTDIMISPAASYPRLDHAEWGCPLPSPDQLARGVYGVRQRVLLETLAALEEASPTRRYHALARDNIARWAAQAKAAAAAVGAGGEGGEGVGGEGGCSVLVLPGDWGAVALEMSRRFGTTFAVLNMANAYGPGGGYMDGTAAQEENMFRRTDCHFSLDPAVMEAGRDLYVASHSALLNAADGRVMLDTATPRVCVRGPEDMEQDDLGYAWLDDDEVFPFYELRAAAIDLRDGSRFDAAETERRITAQLDTLAEVGVRHAVLSAFGCGAFRNPARRVAAAFRRAIEARAADFDVIAFGFDMIFHADNYEPFRQAFADWPQPQPPPPPTNVD